MRVFSNNASTTLTDPIDANDIEIVVENIGGILSSFPDVSGPDDFAYLTIEAVDGTFEIVKLTDVNIGTNTFTVVRGDDFDASDPDKTTSRSFAAGSRIEVRATAGAFSNFLQRDGDLVHGGTFGATPTPPADAVTIITRHSTQSNATPTLELGEIALNSRSRALWAGLVAGGGGGVSPELLFSGLFVQSTEPVYFEDNALWFDTSPSVLALKIYQGGEWKVVVGLGTSLTSLILANNTALQSRNAADNDNIDLIKLNASNQLVLGEVGTALATIITDALRMKYQLQMESYNNGTYGTWNLTATQLFGLPYFAIDNAMNGALLGINTKSVSGTTYLYAFGNDGRLSLPAGISPTDPYHAATKQYVDSKIGSGSPVAIGRVSSGGTEVGTCIGFSVTRTTTGTYSIILDSAVTNVNNMQVFLTPHYQPGDSRLCTYIAQSTTQFTVYTGGGHPYAAFDLSFSLSVYDTGL